MSDVEDDDYSDANSGSESEPDVYDDTKNKKKQKVILPNLGRANERDSDEEEEEEEEDEENEEEEEDDEDSDDDDEERNVENLFQKSYTKNKKSKTVVDENADYEEELDNTYLSDDDDDDDDDPTGENYLQKFDQQMRENIITDNHPELKQHNYEEIEALSVVVRDNMGIIIDPLHKTIPFLTKYERARILGERARQINFGAKPFIKVEPSVIDGYLIALEELEQKKIPFIIKRPLANGGCEYWKLKDLELI